MKFAFLTLFFFPFFVQASTLESTSLDACKEVHQKHNTHQMIQNYHKALVDQITALLIQKFQEAGMPITARDIFELPSISTNKVNGETQLFFNLIYVKNADGKITHSFRLNSAIDDLACNSNQPPMLRQFNCSVIASVAADRFSKLDQLGQPTEAQCVDKVGIVKEQKLTPTNSLLRLSTNLYSITNATSGMLLGTVQIPVETAKDQVSL